MPGALRPAFALALPAIGLVTVLVTGCGAVGDAQAPPPPYSGPMASLPGGPPPAGAVLDISAPATAVVVGPPTGMVAVALTDPPRLLLHPLDDAAAPRQVPLPGPAVDLGLAAAGGPLVVPVSPPGSLLLVPLDGDAPSRTELAGTARAAVTVGERTVVALGDRLVVLDGAAPPGSTPPGSTPPGPTPQRTISGFVDAAQLVPAGSKVGVLDRGRAAISLVDPDSGAVGPALHAGPGIAQAVTDRFGRILVTDVIDGELLIFAGDPLLLRQRSPLPGGPYGLAYDPRRDMAWVTLTARNEVVGLRVTGGEPTAVHRFPTVHQPDAVAVDPVSGRVLIASASGAGLQVIDPERVVQ